MTTLYVPNQEWKDKENERCEKKGRGFGRRCFASEKNEEN